MENTNLSKSAENYPAHSHELFVNLEKKKQNFKPSNCIAKDFADEVLFISKTMAEVSRLFICCSSYIPLKIIANELIVTYKNFENTSVKIKNNCRENSEGAVYLFEKRNDILFQKTFSKLEKAQVFDNTDKSYIRHILLLSTLKINICKNFLRFETNEQADGIANEILRGETEKIRKLKYLKNCVDC